MRARRFRSAERLAAAGLFGVIVSASTGFASAEAAAAPSAEAAQAKITLSYSSPAHPWTAAQVTTLKGWAAQALPLITKVYGPPSHSFTVDVVQDPTISYAGEYLSSANTALLRVVAEDVFIHELVHAYRDDDIIGVETWEEGMARAVEVQVATQIMPGYWDASHSYPYATYYDNVNKPKLGVANGSINGQGDPSLALLRYETSSYAWAKIMIQSPGFLPCPQRRAVRIALPRRRRERTGGPRGVAAAEGTRVSPSAPGTQRRASSRPRSTPAASSASASASTRSTRSAATRSEPRHRR